MGASVPQNPSAIIVRLDTIHRPIEPFDTISYPGSDTLITKTEYRRLQARDTLVDMAKEILTDYRNQLKACEDNRAAVYALQRNMVVNVQQGLSQQQSDLTKRPIILQACPLPPKPKATWYHWVISSLALILGTYTGLKLR